MLLTRRHLLGAAAGAAVVGGQPASAKPPAVLRPRRLVAGDVVGLGEPATATWEPFDLDLVEEALGALGLKAKRGRHLLARDGYLAGADRDRAADINAMFADREVAAILAVRGGWGSARVLPFLDFEIIRRNPKALIGYSDITALHLAINAKTGLVTFHGPNGASAWGESSVKSFRSVLFDGEPSSFVNPVADEDRLAQRKWRTQTITPGRASGKLIGGNLTVLTALVGTSYLPDFRGAILFLEDVGEAIYRVDRMLTQLGQAGVLQRLAGVIFGNCTNCETGEGDYSAFTLGEVLKHHLGSLGVPAYRGAFIGHIGDQFTTPIGVRAEIDADQGMFRLLEPAVA